jgi:hypothetical protein
VTGPDLVFLGPSLETAEAARIYPDAIILPPAGMGDIVSAVRRYRPHAIALIDGTFMQSMAPFHKEILDALAQGIWVIGASSMGALRAAECAPYGMIGIGHVAQLYADGLEDDDEVALLHLDADGDYRPVSEAMVNIRATFDAAVADGLLSVDEASLLVREQKARHFPDRHLMASVQDARTALGFDEARAESLRAYLRGHVVNVKANDARLAIEALQALPSGPMPEPGPTPVSRVYDATTARDVTVVADNGATATFDQIRRFATLHDKHARATWASVRRRAALAALMASSGVVLTPADIDRARTSLAADLGVTPSDLDAECRALDMTSAEVDAMVREQAYVRRAEEWMIVGASHPMLTTEYLNHLRRTGRYREAREATAFERSVGMHTSHRSTSISLRTALEAFSRLSDFDVPDDIEEYVDEMGMGSRAELYEQIITALATAWEVFGLPLDAPDDAATAQDHSLTPRHSRGTL